MNEEQKQAASTAISQRISSGQSSELPAAMSELVKEAVRQVLPSVIEEKVRQVLPSVIEERIRKTMSSAMEDFVEEYGRSKEVVVLLRLLASKSNDSYEDLLRKALTLYDVALDVRDNGNRLAILNPEDVIVREIVGFEPSDHTPQPVAH